MRILQVCIKPPYPKVDGGCMAMAAMTESMLMAGHEVKLLCMSTHKHGFDASAVPAHILKRTEMEAVAVDTRLKPLDALLNLFSTGSYNVERFHSKDFEARLIEILNETEFDVVHLESIFCTPYVETIRKHSKAKVVVRAHNIEFRIWEQLAAQESNPLMKLYLKLLAGRLKNYELEILKRVDGIVPLTKEDASGLTAAGVKVRMEIIPIGMDVREMEAKELTNDKLHLYHVGAMDWAPNVDGIEWFVNEIWPKLEAEFPQIRCSLAGRKMPASLLSRSKGNLKIDGEVADLSEYVSDKQVAIIPLRTGSGMRVKIVEAMAMGKVVISTRLGAAGIPFEDGKNLLIAETPDEFVGSIRQLAENAELTRTIGAEARKLAEATFDLKNLGSKLTYFYADL